MENSDSWLERLLAGDVAAAESLWQTFFTRLQAYSEVCLRNASQGSADVDDIVQSVFKSLCRMVGQRKIPPIRDPDQLWPLIATIAARKVARLVRRRRPGQILMESDLRAFGIDSDEVSILGQVIGREPSSELVVAMRDFLESMMSRLDAKEQVVAQLWLEGISVSEISAASSISERTVARKLAKIRRLVRELEGQSAGESPES